MAIENNIAATQPKVFQPLPRQDTRRSLTDFTGKSRPAPQKSLALPVQEPAKARATAQTAQALPPAPMFPRQVEREAPMPAAIRAAANAPKPRTQEAPSPTARAGVPIQLNALMREARGREVVANIKQTGGLQTAAPANRVAPAKASVERAPVAVARTLESAGASAPVRPRFQAMAAVSQEITQLNARQTLQNTVRDRGVAENAGAGRVRAARTLIDQRV